MRKAAIIIVLALVILLSFGFVYAKGQAQGPDNNYFNTHLRSWFDRSLVMRNVLGLHYDGDGRYDYLGGKYKKILIEVDIMSELSIRTDGLNLLVQKIQDVTGKPTSYVISDKNIQYARDLTIEGIAQIVASYRNHKNSKDTAMVYLLYASRDQANPQTLGITYQEYGIVLFGDELGDFIQDNASTLPLYEESTALHEFGHQLGLDHNDKDSCLMNQSAEESHVALEKPEDVVTDFCDFEKSLIRGN
jgi:hypothetical protein